MRPTAAAKPSNLRTRLTAAGILLPVVLALFIWGPSWVVAVFLGVCLTLSVGEVAVFLIPALERKLAGDGGYLAEGAAGRPLARAFLFPGVAVALGWIALAETTASVSPDAAIGMFAVCALVGLAFGTFSSTNIDLAAARASGILISLCYGAVPWLVIWQLYLLAPHAPFILLVMAVTWSGDTGGYFGGRYYGGKIFGSRKLAPVISPKKTWEGAVCGLALSVLGGFLLNLCFFNELGSVSFIAKTSVAGGIAAQIGDLVESMFKRFAGVKDSGTIIPGHGGFLDRVDGILFAGPVIWAILYCFR